MGHKQTKVSEVSFVRFVLKAEVKLGAGNELRRQVRQGIRS
jgi:hypothetical protein